MKSAVFFADCGREVPPLLAFQASAAAALDKVKRQVIRGRRSSWRRGGELQIVQSIIVVGAVNCYNYCCCSIERLIYYN